MSNDAHSDARTDSNRTDTRDNSDRTTDSDRDSRPTMGDISHTNPYTGESFGNTVAYQRGRTLVVDGGEAETEPADDAADESETMGDISHEPPHDAPNPNAVHMRGGEGDDDADETAETE